MGGRRRLKSGAVRLLGRHDGAEGRVFRRAYDALDLAFGPFAKSSLLRLEASRAAVAWVNFEAATQALMIARHQREHGTGRRPSGRDLERLARRQGLADQTYAMTVARLEALVSRRDLRPPPLSELVKAQKERPA